MKPPKPNILYLCHESYSYAGATRSLINMIDSIKEQVNPIVVVKHKGGVSQELDRLGIENIVCNFKTFYGTPKTLRFIAKKLINPLISGITDCIQTRQIRKKLQGAKIDIVHTNTSVITFGEKLSKALGAKHIWHIREYQDLDFNLDVCIGRKRLTHKLHNADAVIAISSDVYKHWGLENARNSYCLANATNPYLTAFDHMWYLYLGFAFINNKTIRI